MDLLGGAYIHHLWQTYFPKAVEHARRANSAAGVPYQIVSAGFLSNGRVSGRTTSSRESGLLAPEIGCVTLAADRHQPRRADPDRVMHR
jgi:hypothetical protein